MVIDNGKMQTYEEHAVNVVKVTVLPSTVVDVVPRHTDLGAVENGRLQAASIASFRLMIIMSC